MFKCDAGRFGLMPVPSPPLWGRGREGGTFMPEPSTIAIIVSATALSVSLVTMWITLFRRGSLKMTQPTTVMFGPDGRHHEGDPKKFSASTSIFDSKTRTRNRKYVCKSFTWRTPTELSNLGTRQRETFSG